MRDQHRHLRPSDAMADLTILYCSDAHEWDNYLTQCLLQVCEPKTLNVRHETLDSFTFPLSAHRVQSFMSSKATLVIISPDFLDYVESKAEVFEVGKLLDPSTTVAMLCGVRESDVGHLHRAALVSYDEWPQLTARDQDKDFVLDVIKRTQDILTRTDESRTINRPKFKITPRKVKLGHNKVYILLNEEATAPLQVFLEGEDFREVEAKTKNPFTLQLLVPDSYLGSSRMLNVHVRTSSAGEPLLGVQPLKVESQMGELFSLLSSVNSPYDLICQTYGVSTHKEVDRLLAESFALRMPFGLSLLENVAQAEKKKSEEELPTLVHFAARYGLEEMMNQLLMCPGAAQACFLRNSRGLTPGQMASHARHHRLTALLEEFQKCPSPKKEVSLGGDPQDRTCPISLNQGHSYVNVSKSNEDPHEPYDIPSRIPLPVQERDNIPAMPDDVILNRTSPEFSQDPDQEVETGYLDMRILRVLGNEKLLPHQALLLELSTRQDDVTTGNVRSNPREEILDIIVSDGTSPTLNHNDGQHELLQLIERYKKGASWSEVEKDFKLWQNKHNNSDLQGSLVKLKDSSKGTSKKPTKNKSFSFPDFKYFVLSKFNKKEAHADVTTSPKLPSKSFMLEDLEGGRPLSTLSSSSSASRASTLSSVSSNDRFSTLSFGSAYDSGHQSDSCDESHRGVSKDCTPSHKLPSPAYSPSLMASPYTAHRIQKSVYSHNQVPRTSHKYPENCQVPPPYQKATGSSSPSPKAKLKSKVSISSRPPAPPPRPATLKKSPLNVVTPAWNADRVYYNQHELPVCPISPDYVSADNEDYLLVNRDKQDHKSPAVAAWHSGKVRSAGGEYYEVPALPSPVGDRSRLPSLRSRVLPTLPISADEADPQGDYSFPSSLPVTPGTATDLQQCQYYDVPRASCLLSAGEQCDSIPEELAPPPPPDS